MVLWDLLNLALYCVQQLGVTLGVGAESVLIAVYISSMRDGVIDSTETRMARAVHKVLRTGLALIIISGAIIAGLHFLTGQKDVLLEPAFLFKWCLIGFVLLFSIGVNIKWPLTSAEGLAAGSWFALFVVHILAPVTSWTNLAELYVVWMIGFILCWEAIVYGTRPKKSKVKVVSEKIASPLPSAKPSDVGSAPKIVAPAPKPVMPPPPVVQPPPPAPIATPIIKLPPPPPANLPVIPAVPTLPVVKKEEVIEIKKEIKIEDPDKNPDLPAIRVMPRTPEDLQNQNRATLVKLD